MPEFNQIVDQFNTLITNSKQHILFIIELLAGIWAFNLTNWALGSIFNILGTIPRSRRGVLGIFCSWVLHANFNHLFFNSIPLFVLSLLLISFDQHMFFNVSILIIFLEGISVWLIGRHGNHMGASGVVAGYFGFSLIFAYQAATVVSFFLGFIALYYFGGILLSFFPTEDKSSWESHLFGFIAGLVTFFLIFRFGFMPIDYFNFIVGSK